MSPKHADFDRAIEGLQAELPSGERRLRALRRIERPQASRWRLSTLAAASLCVLAGAVLTVPSRGNRLTWNDVVHHMQSAESVHTLTFDRNGHPTGEMWRSGDNFADVFRDSSGHLISESRRDGEALYYYSEFDPKKLPNAYYYGRLMRTYPRKKNLTVRSNTVTDMLSDTRTTLVSHETVTVGGRTVERYQVKLSGGEPASVEADPSSGRLLKIVHKTEVSQFDYPGSIDPKVFSWKSRITKNAPVLDMRGWNAKVPLKLPKLIASKDGVQLRDVSISPTGSLMVSWSGNQYARLLLKPFRVTSARAGKPWYGPAPYRSGKQKLESLTSVSLPLLEKVGNRLTIEIPTGARTVARFENVPVSRLRPLP